jgi:hypothetical protein
MLLWLAKQAVLSANISLKGQSHEIFRILLHSSIDQNQEMTRWRLYKIFSGTSNFIWIFNIFTRLMRKQLQKTLLIGYFYYNGPIAQ